MVKDKQKCEEAEQKKLKQAEEDRLFENLIIKLEENPVLYDREQPNYKNAKLKDGILKGIASDLKISVTDVIKKIRYLRDGYTKEKKNQEKESASGAGTSKRKSFRFFHQMGFIAPFIRKSSSVCTLTDSDDEDENDRETIAEVESLAESITEDIDAEDGFLNPGSPNSERALKEVLNLEKALRADDAPKQSSGRNQLFPDTKNDAEEVQVRKSPRKHPTPPKSPAKKSKTSHSLSPGLPILGAPVADVKSKRSKAKRDLELSEQIGKVVEVLGKSVAAECSTAPVIETTAVGLLCSSINVALKKVKLPRRELYWRKEFGKVLERLEEELVEDEDS